MSKAITVKAIPATETKPRRLKAYDGDGNSVTKTYDSGHLNDIDTHKAVAQALVDKMGWSGQLIGGGIKDAYVFVFAPPAYEVFPSQVARKRIIFENLDYDERFGEYRYLCPLDYTGGCYLGDCEVVNENGEVNPDICFAPFYASALGKVL